MTHFTRGSPTALHSAGQRSLAVASESLRARSDSIANMWHHIGAGGGTRTLMLSRAPAPKAGVYAISPRPRAQRSYRSARRRICRWSLLPWDQHGERNAKVAIRRGVRNRAAASLQPVKTTADRKSDRHTAKDSVGLARRSPIRARSRNASSGCSLDHDFSGPPCASATVICSASISAMVASHGTPAPGG